MILTAFGKIKIPGLREAADHYVKMLSQRIEIQEHEFRAARLEGRAEALRTQAQKQDQETLRQWLAKEKRPTQLWLLDEKGRSLTSAEWAGFLTEAQGGRIVIAVGSAQGWSADFKKSARGLLSLGPQTLCHDLARVVLLEQLYRASAILAHHPYHIEG